MTVEGASMGADLLGRVLAPQPPPFALLSRPETTSPAELDVLVGTISRPATLADIPLPEELGPSDGPRQHVLAMVPYRQIRERGFACADDGAPLIAMTVTDQDVVTSADALRRLPTVPLSLAGGHFDVDDGAYADIVRKIVSEEIGSGEGSNFVIKRSFLADITDYKPHSALTFFRRLLEQEAGAYWTFIIHTGTRTFVGASPERHISVRDGTAVMNPISGTFRYPASGPTLSGILEFLADPKEAAELCMVVDEELKMMARICATGGRVTGPYLKEMARLAHTEYLIEGHSARDPRDILRETMFAPTVTGSPLESACRVISRYEPLGRGYYGGFAALLGCDASGGRTLDSAIFIRTADIDNGGHLQIGVGGTLVRLSEPDSEVAETAAKAAALIGAFGSTEPVRFSQHSSVRAALAGRNTTIADFWLAGDAARSRPDPVLAGRRVLIIDAEDNFTCMLDHQLRSLGLSVSVCRFDEPYIFDGYDLVVMGPGPGDPRDITSPKIIHLRRAIGTLLREHRPFVAICLSHQVLSTLLGLTLARRDVPAQGLQREIDLFGTREVVGFYNTFAAQCREDSIDSDEAGIVHVSRDPESGEVHGLRGRRFVSLQFHPESVLTQGGVRIVRTFMKEVCTRESNDRLVGSR
jgi:phenazine biosynthesis protein phzE